MKAKNIVGLVLVVVILGLFVLMFSQEGSKKIVVEEKKDEVVAKLEPKLEKSEEEKHLEDLKKQAGKKVDYEVSAYYKVACSSCHGKGGEGTQVAPAIAGQQYEYLIEKLDDYKNGKVQNTLMQSGLFTNITEDELKQLAMEIANFK